MLHRCWVLLAVFFLNAGRGYSDTPSGLGSQAIVLEKLNRYAASRDTAGLQSVLTEMNEQFGIFTSREFCIAIDACIQKAQKSGTVEHLKAFYTLQGKWYQFNNDISQAIEQYSKVYNLLKSQNRENESIWILIDIGNLFYSIDNFSDAILFYNKAGDLATRTSDNYALSVVNLNLGLVESARGNYPQAVASLKKCILLREGTKENAFKSHTYIKLSEVYSMMNQMDSVFYYIRSAEQLYYAEGTSVGILHEMPSLIGMAYYKYYQGTGDSRLAEMNLSKVRAFTRSKGLKGRLYESFLVEAEINLKFGNHQLVIDSLTPILSDLQASRYRQFHNTAMHLLAQAYYETENYLTSKDYYEKYIHELKSSKEGSTITNSAFNGLLNTQAKTKENAAQAIASAPKSAKGPLYLLSFASTIMLIMIVVFRRKLKYQKARISELNRTLNRQNEEFSTRLTKRLREGN